MVTSREKSTAGAPNLLTAGELQLASDTNASDNALSLAHCIFVGDNCTYCRRIAAFARGNVLPLANTAMHRQQLLSPVNFAMTYAPALRNS
jgi:hypothetical protein